MTDAPARTSVAIACGGTGGHLFPGLAVAEQLRQRECAVTLLVSPKEVDQQAVARLQGLHVVTLPAVALQDGSRLAFFRGFAQSYRAAKKLFGGQPPQAALGMGGFTSAPPLLAARRCGAAIFLHESNAIPGRANRWLSWIVDRAFVGFPSAASRLHGRATVVTGTPVRPQFVAANRGSPSAPAMSRLALGLHPDRPVVLVVGGSQGASGLNDALVAALPLFAKLEPETQWIHLTGRRDLETVTAAYAAARLPAIVLPFFDAMEVLLSAASVAVSRAGASCLAELAALRVPSVLVPFPAAADNHQWHNARRFEETGAARLLEQKRATPETLTGLVRELLNDSAACERTRTALGRWHAPRAAADIAESILKTLAQRQRRTIRETRGSGDSLSKLPGSRPAPGHDTETDVAQVSKPAVSPISKSARWGTDPCAWKVETLRVWQPAIRQVWKPALRPSFERGSGHSDFSRHSSVIA